MLTRHAALFLLLGLPGLVRAQSPDAVALTVRVRAEGEAVAGAVVRVGAEQVKTDAAGQVTLALPPGGHDLTVEAPGFVPAVASAVLVAGTASNVTVEMTALEEEVFVSATRSETRLEDQPLRVEVIDRE